MGLFEKDLKVSGKHSLYLSDLKEAKVFPTYREIYTVCAAIGYLYGLKAPADYSENVKASTVFASDLIAQRSNLRFLYRLIMLTDDKEGFELDDYKNRAFRDDAIEDNDEKMKENMEIFNSYFRGGLEKVHEMLQTLEEPKEKTNAIKDFLVEMCEDYGFIINEY